MSLAGLHAMMALKAGARHVTAVDRWLYMALACREALVSPPCSHVMAPVYEGIMPVHAYRGTYHRAMPRVWPAAGQCHGRPALA